MDASFGSKQAAREAVWDALQEEGVARFPFPPQGRIPNFDGSRDAADRLLSSPVFAGAKHVKVNPDAPQRFVRASLLEEGVMVFVPTPRLRGGFNRLDPGKIPSEDRGKAAALSRMDVYAEPCPLDALPQMDVIVAGSVAVTQGGHRVGKGEGYSDLEYAILQELGHGHAPVVTTVHPLQVVDEVPRDATDVPLSLIATPEGLIEVDDPLEPPAGIDWGLLSEERLDAMPILATLKDATSG